MPTARPAPMTAGDALLATIPRHGATDVSLVPEGHGDVRTGRDWSTPMAACTATTAEFEHDVHEV